MIGTTEEEERERNQENVKIMSSGVAVSRYIGAAPLAVVHGGG